MTYARPVAAVAALALLVAGCGGQASGGQASGRQDRAVTVLAAASLTDVVTDLAARFERAHPGVDVRTSFGGSSSLAAQVAAGAAADVLATADRTTMRQVVEAGSVAGRPVVIAANRLVLAVPRDNPGRVRGLADLARADLTVALCEPQVPCGAAAESTLRRAGVRAAVDTYEQDVRAVLTKVELGEVDAALVYATDVRATRGRVLAIALDPDVSRPTDYVVAVLSDAQEPGAARRFVTLLRSPAGQRAFARAGFLPPRGESWPG